MKNIPGISTERFFGRHLDLRVRLFSVLALAGTAISLIMALSGIFTEGGFSTVLVNLTIAGLSFGLFYITHKTGRYQLCYLATVLGVFMILFPILFFQSGGYHGGMPAFFVFAVAFSVFMLEGRAALIVSTLELLLYIGLCLFAYFNPDAITSFQSEANLLQDVMVSFSVVSVALGLAMYFHFRLNYAQQRELELARNEALALSKVKTTFLANISHEIRTPINVVLGMNEMILRESKSEQIMHYAATVQNAGKTLLTLINNILDIAKIESGKLELLAENYKTADLIFDLALIGQERAAKHGLIFHTQVDRNLPSVLFGDPLHIKQVIVNFLSNAVKYTKEGLVTLGFDYQTDGDQILLRIMVKDTGVGIEEENLEYLFQSFTRVDHPEHRLIEGSGLGLAIAKELTELMKGTIHVESKVGFGSCFTMEIPQLVLDPTPLGTWEFKESAATQEKRSFLAPAARILVVDDNKENLEVIKALLKQSLLQIDTAKSGRECLASVAKTNYDLILMDYMMPDLDGLETLRLLRQRGCTTPVAAVTANVLAGTKETLLRAGFSGFLPKPIIWRDLDALLIKQLPQELVVLKTVDAAIDEKIVADLQIKTAPYGISVAEGLKYVNGDLKQYQTIVEIFREHSHESKAEIKTLLEDGDFEGLTYLIHSLKSKALTVGAVELAEQAAELEKHLRGGDDQYAKVSLPLIMFLWDRVICGLLEVVACSKS